MIKAFKITKHKAFELQTGRWKDYWSYFDFQFKWNRKCDHAGIFFSIEIFGVHLYLNFYDIRHWSDDNKWCELGPLKLDYLDKEEK